MDPAHLNKLFSISNWLFLIPCYCQNSIGDLWNTLVPTYLPSYMSHRFHRSYTVIQSYKVILASIHSFIHSYINTFHVVIHSWVYSIYTTLFIHGCISHLESCLAVSFQFGPHSSLCHANSLQLPFCYFCAKLIACKHLYLPLSQVNSLQLLLSQVDSLQLPSELG